MVVSRLRTATRKRFTRRTPTAPPRCPLTTQARPTSKPPTTNRNLPGANNYFAPNYADIDIRLGESQTGKMTFGAAFNSNSGLVGQIIIDEKNFDIAAFPRSFGEIINGTAWRGAGQGFRMELVPGDQVQRYLVSFTEPYLFNSNISLTTSGYFFDRQYFDWDEQRLGGRVSLGYRLTPDLSISAGVRMENVDIKNPRVGTSPSLNSVLGDSSLFLGHVSLINDTRDHPFMASEGFLLRALLLSRIWRLRLPAGRFRLPPLLPSLPTSRRVRSTHVKHGYQARLFRGGHSHFRKPTKLAASLRCVALISEVRRLWRGGVRAGGRFQWLNTVEYTFPITADDMLKGVFFCDFGTVEQNIGTHRR